MAWVSVALLLVANAVFNTLGRAHVATMFNWGRATLGTVPFLWLAQRGRGRGDHDGDRRGRDGVRPRGPGARRVAMSFRLGRENPVEPAVRSDCGSIALRWNLTAL